MANLNCPDNCHSYSSLPLVYNHAVPDTIPQCFLTSKNICPCSKDSYCIYIKLKPQSRYTILAEIN